MKGKENYMKNIMKKSGYPMVANNISNVGYH